MGTSCNMGQTLLDYVTGRAVCDRDDEDIRQVVEHILVDQKGYDRADIEVDRWFDIEIDGKREQGRAELVVSVLGRPFMTFKCSRGSLVSRERQALAASRLCCDRQVPYTVVTNGREAEFMDTLSGRILLSGLAAIPDKQEAMKMSNRPACPDLNEVKRVKEGRVYLAFADIHCPLDCPEAEK